MKKEIWLEKLRVLATFAVVLIHVVQGSYQEETSNIPWYRFWFDTSFLMGLTSWAVPVFLMISGYLLLDPQKELPLKKLKRYMIRIFLILASVGFVFCFIESAVNAPNQGLLLLGKDALLHLIAGNSWAHLWYLYLLPGLYLLTPLLRAFVKEAEKETVWFVMGGLFVVTILFPTLEHFFGITITKFYLSEFPYLFYYFFGYYVKKLNCSINYGYGIGSLALMFCLLISAIQPQVRHFVYYYDSVLLALLSMSIFFVAYRRRELEIVQQKSVSWITYFSNRSFWIYLSHPIVFNLFNKGLGIVVTQFPIGFGEALFFVIAMLFCVGTYEIVVRLPFFGTWIR